MNPLPETPITLQVVSHDTFRDKFNVRTFAARHIADNPRIRRAAELEVAQRNRSRRFQDTTLRTL